MSPSNPALFSSSHRASAQLSPKPQTSSPKAWSQHSHSSCTGAMPKGSAMTSPSNLLSPHWTSACQCSVKPRQRQHNCVPLPSQYIVLHCFSAGKGSTQA
eukprot:1305043-Rhodomonas_salina.3